MYIVIFLGNTVIFNIILYIFNDFISCLLYSKHKDGDMVSYIYPMIKNNVTTYKVYFLYESKKIYLGTYSSLTIAKEALNQAEMIMNAPTGTLTYNNYLIGYKKFISLCNFRDHKIYIKNPIYVYPTYFYYYLSNTTFLIFDSKDLLFFSTYKICKRGNYLYTQDSISQKSILSRFNIMSHSIAGKDYLFKNGNPQDFRRANLEIINSYKGVSRKEYKGQTVYVATIFMDKNITIGHYSSEMEAAIAYNKAIDLLYTKGISNRNYVPNTIPFLTLSEYKLIYDGLSISPRLLSPLQRRKRVFSIKTFRGTCEAKNSFRASIGYKGKQIFLGMYPTEKRAAQAYNFASFYLYGPNGHVNDITPLVDDHDIAKIAAHLAKHHISK